MKFLDLKKITDSFQPQITEAIARVIASGSFVRGVEVDRFEQAYAAFTGAQFCVGVGNGFDALRLIFKAYIELGRMKPGDEIIVPANTYIASILAITENGLAPVLVEPDLETFNIDPQRIQEKVTCKTKGIMIVHLYGRNAMHPDIAHICQRHNLVIIEDNAQAAGCFSANRRTGTIGNAAGHSFYPTKNLGALGDGGAITSNDDELSAAVRTLANYGSSKKGVNDLRGINSRLDEIQAAVLNVKLSRLDADNSRRAALASYYLYHIKHPEITLPLSSPDRAVTNENVWHLFVIRCRKRDTLQSYLSRQGIETAIHYPIPPHKQRAYPNMNGLSFPITELLHRETLSLPLNPVLETHEIERVVEVLNGWN